MVAPKTSDAEFVRDFEEIGPSKLSAKTGVNIRRIHERRVVLEKKIKRQITPPRSSTRHYVKHPERAVLDIKDGAVLIGSDCHYWPGDPSTAHRAFIKFCKELAPVAVIMNGDVMDFGSISRFPPIGWESQPTVAEEIGGAQKRMREITEATPGADHVWTLGNHDGRFETKVATAAPELAKVDGVHLKDHFPEWHPCWSVWINDEVVVKHRFKGGIHAPWNNVKDSGKTIITGHLHSQKCTPFTNYNGTTWGVDTGCMADTFGPQFEYMEDNPRNWRAGFGVFTFANGELLDPELVRVWDENRVCFRGALIDV